jgi:alpha-galactosidase
MRRLLTAAIATLTVIGAALITGGYDAASPRPAYALDNGLATTPPMGFNDWNAFQCNVSEQLIKDTADLFVSSGLKAAGYQYVNIDDCWMTHDRDPQTGRLIPDPAKFPDGIKGTADYVHSKGLKLGIYEDAGTATCAGYPGSLGHEDLDAQTFADWTVDYLKYDNCNNAGSTTTEQYIARYSAMRDALAKTGRQIVYSICEWGVNTPWTWAPAVGNLWRTTGDISDNWASLKSIINQNLNLYPFAKPGAWNDPDMLEIGNGGMTDTEYRTHFAVWAMLAAPLLIGSDLRKATPATMQILTNTDIIAIDQDPLGKQAKPIVNSNGLIAFARPLAGGDAAVALYNSTDTPARISTSAQAAGLRSAVGYTLKDLWSKKVTETAGQITASVPAHGTVIYRVARTNDVVRYAPSTWVSAQPPVPYSGAPDPLVKPGTDTPVTTTFGNDGRLPATAVALALAAPDGWEVTPESAPISPAVTSGRTFATKWTLRAPLSATPGSYPLTVTGLFAWGAQHWASVTSTVNVLVATPLPAGTSYLGDDPFLSASSFWGPIERNMSNGERQAGDGHTITIGGVTYPKGLGLHAPSEVDFYTGGACTHVSTDVGIDDEKSGAGDVIFQIWADGRQVASVGANWQDAPKHLDADVTGAQVIRLVVDPNGDPTNDHADWAGAQITC